MENIAFGFRIIDGLMSLGLIYTAYRLFGLKRKTIYFSLFMIGTYATITLFVNDSTFSGTWTKHLVFYASQICFYLFLSPLVKINIRPNEIIPSTSPAVLPAVMVMSAQNLHSFAEWGRFLTDQGLQHTLTAPLFFIIVAKIRAVSLSLTSSHLKTTLHLLVLNFLFLGFGLMVAIHMQEFLVESQKLITLPESIAETLETVWFFAATLAIATAFVQLKTANKAEYAK